MAATLSFVPKGTQILRGSGGVYTAIAEVKKMSLGGSKSELLDASNMDSPSAEREYVPGMLTPGEFTLDCNFLNADATQALLLSDYNNQTLSPWRVQLPNARGKYEFNAYVGSNDFDLEFDKIASRSVKLMITGAVTYTPSV